MATVNFIQKVRHALIPMCRATVDALLLTAFIFIGFLVFPSILLSYPWLILLIYAVAYLLTVVIRLRQAAGKLAHQETLTTTYSTKSGPSKSVKLPWKLQQQLTRSSREGALNEEQVNGLTIDR